mmetsp:Transcript_162422/g.296442  ORF Transcript_162422/g.296442 Transcript_162422/m.296442 type:complete len:433 (+) Transcript_162422:129-1427(+)
MAATIAASAARDSMPGWWQKAAKASIHGAPPVLPRPESAMAAVLSDETGRRGTKNLSDVKSRNSVKKGNGRLTIMSRTRPKSAGLSATAAARKAVAAAHLATRNAAVAAVDLTDAEAQEAVTDLVVANAIPPIVEQEPSLTWAAPRTPRERRTQLPTEDDADSGSRVSKARRFKKGAWPVSVVCPAEVRDLRGVSISRGHGCVAAEHSASVRADARATKATGMPLDYIDLQGGNGRWRQKKAEVEFEQRRAEEEVRQQEESVRREERRRMLAEVEARRRQHLLEVEARCREEHQRRLREEAEEQQRKMQELEQERLRREAEERERLARQPRDCQTCGGDGLCRECKGEGFVFTLFLSANVNSHSTMNYGRVLQGCEKCGGVSKGGVSDHLHTGSGKCVTCKGEGKLVPLQTAALSDTVPVRSRNAFSPRSPH